MRVFSKAQLPKHLHRFFKPAEQGVLHWFGSMRGSPHCGHGRAATLVGLNPRAG